MEKLANPFTCHACATQFSGRRGFNKYCSAACRRAVEHAVRLERRHASGVQCTGATVKCARCAEEMIFGGRRSLYCGPCVKARRAESTKAYRSRNPDKRRILDQRKSERIKADDNLRNRRQKYAMEATRRRRNTPRGRLDHRMGQLVRNGLGGVKNGRTWNSLVGYSLEELMIHLEKQFAPKMGWHNIGEWHIDHILPRAMFEYQSHEDDDFRACWAITNLRPLWSEENISKGAKRLLLI